MPVYDRSYTHRVEGHLIAVVDHPVIEEFLEVEVVANEVLDQLTGGPRLRVGLVLQPVLRNRAENVGKEAAFVGGLDAYGPSESANERNSPGTASVIDPASSTTSPPTKTYSTPVE